ncbi:MAG: cyclase family protein [Candidatus Tectomicrobia bacterium]|nr:cyclase family protein [Candidatus Tectomicrobia bacterium]
MLLYDITRPLSPALPVYPGDPVIDISPIAQRVWGDAANVSRMVLSSHSGTHLDAPRHFFDAGLAVDAVSLHVLLGAVRVVELPGVAHISLKDVQRLDLEGVTRVLFKTRNSALWECPGFQPDYLAFTPDAAQLLAEHPIQLVGIDYLSVDAFEALDFPVHRLLLGAGIVILEGLDLRAVPPGDYDLCALPLLLEDGDGAPARVVLRALP